MTSALRILLVEDSDGDALLIREHLDDVADFRYELVRATRLEEARDRLAEHEPDVVLLDLGLPGSRGSTPSAPFGAGTPTCRWWC